MLQVIALLSIGFAVGFFFASLIALYVFGQMHADAVRVIDNQYAAYGAISLRRDSSGSRCDCWRATRKKASYDQ